MNESLSIDQIPDNSRDADILKGILLASTDACWCMEFSEPVDLTDPDVEVVRQVFDNGPYWRFCNSAMSQLYLLPSGEDLTQRPVAEIFPRSAQNEAFVRNLLSNGFEANGLPALDVRYDGVEIHVENDVRAHIEGGHLIRMFGIVRDVGKHYRREAELSAQLSDARSLINMLPDAVFGADAQGRVLLISNATTTLLGVEAASLRGLMLQDIITSHFYGDNTRLLREIASGIAGASGQTSVLGRKTRWTLAHVPAARADAVAMTLVLQGDEAAA